MSQNDPGSPPTAAAVAPSILGQPISQTTTPGSSATFAVQARGSDPLTYQWTRDGSPIAGATAANYTTPAATPSDDGATFAVTVSNPAGTATSSGARLTVNTAPGSPDASLAPTITQQPAGVTTSVGQAATFSVAATGSAPLGYQWRRNAVAIAGANAARYTTPAAARGDDGAIFSVTVSNSAGSVTSAGARLSVAAETGGVAPTITAQPGDQSVAPGHTARFLVAAAGSAPLTYQWQKNGASIVGAASSSYTTPPATNADNGTTFAVVVSNAAGRAVSRAARLTVAAAPSAPTITSQPADRSVTAGQTATFTVAATGTAPLAYQWQKNGTAIAGATAASYTSPAATGADDGATFTVSVSNAAGRVVSRAARLTVSTAVTHGPGTDVVTYKNDLARTAQNLSERILTPANVNSASFGKLRFLATDGKVDAQPLYLSALAIGGTSHNVVFVATENDSVYAFDADTGATLWHVSLLGAGETPSDARGCDQVAPVIGITSTPVIDRGAGAHGTLYVVAMSNGGSYHQRLHALDVTSGAELAGGPTEIAASFPAPGGARRTFDPAQYAERAALLLSHGIIYTSWTSHCDIAPYTGWVIAYSQTSLAQTAVLNVAPNGTGGDAGTAGPAIWMSGGGPAADAAGNVYLLTANGAFETALDARGFPSLGDYANSFLKLSGGSGSLAVVDYFTMYNELTESAADADLGSGGIMLLPDLTDSSGVVRHLAVGAGKDGNLYVVNRDSMGRFNADGNNIWQQLTGVLGAGIWSTPAWFNGTLYYGPTGAPMLAFSTANARLTGNVSSRTANYFVYPGSAPAVSANGTQNGIVWAHQNSNPAVLHAYDAGNLGHELYNSSQAGSRDQFGAGNKFITPTIADGKVFVGTQSGVAVFGLLH